MEKIKIFVSKIEDAKKKENEINKFLKNKIFISLTQTQSAGHEFTMVIFTLVYKEKPLLDTEEKE